MLRSLLSVFALSAFLISAAQPGIAARSRCPVKEPETLLSLYKNSDAIFLAQFERTEYGDVAREGEGYQYVTVRKYFTVSTTLKGKSQPGYVVEDEEYRPMTTEEPAVETENESQPATTDAAAENKTEAAVEEQAEQTDEEDTSLKPGDLALIFLKKDDDDPKKLVVTDYRDAVKQLTAEQSESYSARIRDLNSIFNSKQVSDAAVLDWLIRCMQDKHTRWEGAYELRRSFQNLKWQQEREAQLKEKAKNGEKTDEDDLPDGFFARGAYAKLLGDHQKQSISNILLDSYSAPKQADESGNRQPDQGDLELIRLVGEWGDPRLAEFLLGQVQNEAVDSNTKGDLMQTIADILDDERVTGLAERFSSVSYQDDGDTVDADDIEADDDPAVEGETASPTATEAPATAQVEPDAAPANGEDAVVAGDAAKKDAPAPITYKQLRSELQAKFVSLVTEVMIKAETGEVASVSR